MEPPSGTDVVRVVRITGAVVSETITARRQGWFVAVAIQGGHSRHAGHRPPTRAPVNAAMATTRRAESSVIGERNLSGLRPAVGAWSTRREIAGTARLVDGSHNDDSRRFCTRGVVGRSGLFGTQLIGILEGRAVRVDTSAFEPGVAVR